MIINNEKISFHDAIKISNYEQLLLKRRENNFLLSDYQVSVLLRNGIDYKKYVNIRDLMFDIESCLDDDFDEELDQVSAQLSEYLYYSDTKK